MTDAVIVSYARTGLAKSWRGALNMTHGATMGAHAVRHAIERAGIDAGRNRRRPDGLRLSRRRHRHTTSRARSRSVPVARSACPGATVNRFCSSGLQTIALAAQRIIAGEGEVFVAGGVESISCVQNEIEQAHVARIVARRAQARHLLADAGDRGERRAALRHLARGAGRVRRAQPAARGCSRGGGPVRRRDRPDDSDDGRRRQGVRRLYTREVTLAADEGIRADTTYEGVAKIKPALPGGVIAAGNASQFSDGAAACVVMSDKLAARSVASSRWAFSAASRSPAASPTRWASARCSRYRSCSRAPA